MNTSLDVSQYAHKTWTIRDGFFKGMISSMAQTPDGYMWIGTEFGLLRFDGVRPVEWTPPQAERLPNQSIRGLRAGRDGTLWIGTQSGLASWNGSKLIRYHELDDLVVASILEDREGTVWAGGVGVRTTGRLCAIRSGKAQCYGEDGSLGAGIISLYEDRSGNLWAGGFSELWWWKPGPPKRYPMAKPEGITEDADGHLLIAAAGRIVRLENGKAVAYPVRPVLNAYGALRDRDGGLWIRTLSTGLVHVHQGRTDTFKRLDGLSADDVLAIFEDREGSIWVSTYEGLDRFRELPIVSVSSKQGLSGGSVLAVLAARDGTVWLSGRNGLDRWKGGAVTTLGHAGGLSEGGPHSLFQEHGGRVWAFSPHGAAYLEDGRFIPIRYVPDGPVTSIAEDGDSLWLSTDQGLAHVSDGRLAEQFLWPRLGTQIAMALARDPNHGGLWLGLLGGGVSYFKDGQVRRSYTAKHGLGQGNVPDLRVRADGTLWAATATGLSVINDGHISTLTGRNGLPCDEVYWSMEADDRSTWLYMPCGVVRIERAALDAWITEPNRRIAMTVFDGSEGAFAHVTPGTLWPRVTKAIDGKLWFVTFNGVGVVDPWYLPYNKLPPPVHIEKVIADDKPYDFKPGMRLPANIQSLRIEYTALSLVAPEKVRFKYMLDGQDRGWTEVVNERQVKYTNLPPRQYRFRVIACNNSGVWNETGDTLEFSIAPAWNQTTWFYAACLAVFLAMSWGLFRLRLYQIRREFNAQLDGRVDERLRVARDLHDTMLQTFQAGLIQMQAGYNLLSRRPEKAAEAIEKAITTSAGAIAEGREAIQSMRSSTVTKNDLARALRVAGEQMAAEGSATFEVRVQGSSRDVHPILRDEVYRIALEALRNAFKHAEAKAIEAEIVYGDSLRVRVRDDGKGINPAILKDGRRSGHYGLPGMRERADRIGGKLDMWSGAGAGTEIQLSIPGNIAFGRPGGGSLFGRFRRKSKSEAAAQG